MKNNKSKNKVIVVQKELDAFILEMGALTFWLHTNYLLTLTAQPSEFAKQLNSPSSPTERLTDAINSMWNFGVANEDKVYWLPDNLSIDEENSRGFLIVKSQENQKIALMFELATLY